MNRVPPPPELPEDLDAQYRRASALDPSRPSETVRRAVLAHAAQLASERAGKHAGRSHRAQLARWQRWWHPAIFGTLAAAGLAGLLIAPRFSALFAPRSAPMTAEPAAAQGARPAAPPASPALAANNRADERKQVPEPASPGAMLQPRASLPAADVPEQAARARRGTSTPHSGGAPGAAGGTAEAAEEARAAGPGAAAGGFPGNSRQALSRASSPMTASAPSEAAEARTVRSADPAAAFRHAAEVGDLARLEALRQRQVDINSGDQLGRTALMLATLNGQSNAVAALLAYGADPNLADARGITPLQAALAGDRKAIIATLQRYGAR